MPSDNYGGGSGGGGGGDERKKAAPNVKKQRTRVKREEKEEQGDCVAATDAGNLSSPSSVPAGTRKRKSAAAAASVVSDEDDVGRREPPEDSVRRVRARASPPTSAVAESDTRHESKVSSDTSDSKVKVESVAAAKPGARNRGVKKTTTPTAPAAGDAEENASPTKPEPSDSTSGSDSDDREADPDHVEEDDAEPCTDANLNIGGDDDDDDEEGAPKAKKEKKVRRKVPRKPTQKKKTATAPKARKPRALRPGQKSNPGVHATTQAIDKRAKFRQNLIEYVKTLRAVLMNEKQILNDPKARAPVVTLGPICTVSKKGERTIVADSLDHPNWIAFYTAAVESLPNVLELVRESVHKRYDCSADIRFPKGAIQHLTRHLRHRGLLATPSIQNVNALTGRFKTTRIVPSKAQTVQCCLARDFNFAGWVNPDPDLVKKGVLQVRTFSTKKDDEENDDDGGDDGAVADDEAQEEVSVKMEDGEPDRGSDDVEDGKYDGEAPLVDLNATRATEEKKKKGAKKKAATDKTPKKAPAARRSRAAPRKATTKSGDSPTDGDGDADARFADESYRPVYADDVATSEKFREFVMTLDSSCVDTFDAFWRSVTVTEYVHYRRHWPTLYPFMSSMTAFRGSHTPSLAALRDRRSSTNSLSSSASFSSSSSSSSSSPLHSGSAAAAASSSTFSLDRAPMGNGGHHHPFLFMALMTSLTSVQLTAFDAFWRHSCLVQVRRFQKTWDDSYEGLRQAMIADEMRRLEVQLREKHRSTHPPRAPPPSDFAASWSTGHELAAAAAASQLSSLSSLGSSLPSLPVAVSGTVAP